jgi:hypothetical protein
VTSHLGFWRVGLTGRAIPGEHSTRQLHLATRQVDSPDFYSPRQIQHAGRGINVPGGFRQAVPCQGNQQSVRAKRNCVVGAATWPNLSCCCWPATAVAVQSWQFRRPHAAYPSPSVSYTALQAVKSAPRISSSRRLSVAVRAGTEYDRDTGFVQEDNSGRSNIFPRKQQAYIKSNTSDAAASQGLGGFQGMCAAAS